MASPVPWTSVALLLGGLLRTSGVNVNSCVPGACEGEGDDAFAALQLGRRGSLTAAVAPDATSVIDQFFESVPNGGSVNRKLISEGQPPTHANELCSRVDWGTFEGVDSPQVIELMEAVGLVKYCDPEHGLAKDDPTCKAFWAGLKAHMELQKQGVTPRFANYSVVNWFQNVDEHYPSWGSTGGVTVSYAPGQAPSAQMSNPNIVSGWTYCNIVQNILREINNQQQTNNCGPTAVLTASSNTNPAGTIKLGLELYWTGTVRQLSQELVPCQYVFDEFPGIVPYEEGQPGWNELSGQCNGNTHFCPSSYPAPQQNSGIQFMWAQAMGSSLSRFATGSCSPSYQKLRYPGMDLKDSVLAEDAAMTVPWQILLLAQQFFTSEYKAACSFCSGSTDQSACRDLCSVKPLTGLDANAVEASLSDFSGEHGDYMRDIAMGNPRITAFQDNIKAQGLELESVAASIIIPSLTPELLQEGCSAPNGAILWVFDGILNSLNGGSDQYTMTVGSAGEAACNHWVYLENCNGGADGSLVIWTWGALFNFHKEDFLNAIHIEDEDATVPMACGLITLH